MKLLLVLTLNFLLVGNDLLFSNACFATAILLYVFFVGLLSFTVKLKPGSEISLLEIEQRCKKRDEI